MLSHGFVIKEGFDDLKTYVYEAAEHIAKIARSEALEEAAKVCDSSAKEPSSFWQEEGCWKHASYYCAEKIRALKEKS